MGIQMKRLLSKIDWCLSECYIDQGELSRGIRKTRMQCIKLCNVQQGLMVI